MRAEATESTRHIDTGTLFHSLSTPYIVFGVDDPDFTILEENEAHAKVAMVERSRVIGRPVLDVFPDTSEAYIDTGQSELLESIRRVISTGKPDSMSQFAYDIKDETGTFKKKYWSMTHYPVRGKSGKIIAVCQETKDVTDEVTVEQRLEQAQHQLDQVLASSMIGTYTWSVKEDRVYADANLAAMFNFPVSAARSGLPLGQFVSVIHADDRQRVQQSIDRSLTSKKPFEAECRIVAGSGIRWVIARGHIEREVDGSARSLSGVVVDITDRKKAEQALTESESRLRFMADSMPQLVWIARPDGYHEYYNQRWYDYTGTTPDKVGGTGWDRLFHPGDHERVIAKWRHSLKTGEQYETEYRLFHAATRTYRWVIGRALPFRDQSGAIVKWYGTSTDIDEQKRAAQIQTFLGNVSKELTSSLDYTRLLKKITKICVPSVADWCTVDLYEEKEGFTQVSLAHADAKKASLAKEFRERNPLSIGQPTGVPAVIRSGKSEYYPRITDEMLEQMVSNKKNIGLIKALGIRSVVIAPLRVREETIGAISFVSSVSGRYYTDADRAMIEELTARISLALANSLLYEDAQRELSARQKLEKELLQEKQKLESRVKERTNQLQLTNEGLRSEIVRRHAVEKELHLKTENLARSNRELEDFAYVASHDLQEPLRKIQAFSNLLTTEYGEQLGDGADYANRMNAAASRMSTLIQDLLAFSRVTTKSNPRIKVDLKEIVADVLIDLETRLEAVNGTVVVGDLPTVKADPTHMRQLFQNLISNALKFHKPGEPPVVNVASRGNDSMWEITVKDNGIGFDEKYADKIFSVFQRLHGRDSYEGTGIGLAVCRKIVERYDGNITAVSEKNKGSTFIIRLPRAKEKKSL